MKQFSIAECRILTYYMEVENLVSEGEKERQGRQRETVLILRLELLTLLLVVNSHRLDLGRQNGS